MYIFIDGEKMNSLANYKYHQGNHWVYEKPLQTNVCGFHIETSDDSELVANTMKELEKLFIKATVRLRPDFSGLNTPVARTFGIYQYGNARATLFPTKDALQRTIIILEIETMAWNGLEDMKKLEEAIWAGTIVPIVSYDREQQKIHPLDVLKQLLLTRKLSWVQRFFLSMRMLAR